MPDVIRRLRLQARSFSRGKVPRATRYSREFQSAVVVAARKRRAEGFAVAGIARDLGLGTQTLTRWLRSRARPPLRRIRILPEPPPAVTATTSLVLVAPNGLRVEGLDIDTLVRVLRSLA